MSGVSDGGQVLDVGCGTGSLTFAAARHAQVDEIIGVDLAPAYLERAKQACSDARITFLEGDVYELKVRSAYLDGEVDSPRSYAATAWAVKGIAL